MFQKLVEDFKNDPLFKAECYLALAKSEAALVAVPTTPGQLTEFKGKVPAVVEYLDKLAETAAPDTPWAKDSKKLADSLRNEQSPSADEFRRVQRALFDLKTPELPKFDDPRSPLGGTGGPILPNIPAFLVDSREIDASAAIGPFMSDELDDDLVPEPAALTPSVRFREPLDLVVMVKSEGMRLDQYVLLHLGADFSRSEVQRAIEAGGVTVNGKPQQAELQGPQERPAPRRDAGADARHPGPRRHPARHPLPGRVARGRQQAARHGRPPGEGELVGHAGQRPAVALPRSAEHRERPASAGIVHRLDKDTSGVILVAKDDRTHRELAMQFETRKVFKEYVAITVGRTRTATPTTSRARSRCTRTTGSG